MREKLLNLMKTEQLTASKLAELLGIQPSGISHILGGRNKPSFDLVQKILRRFPQVNPDWLLLDSEVMFRDEAEQPTGNALFSFENSDPQTEPSGGNSENTKISEGKTSEKNELANIFCRTQNGQKDVDRILILYNDGSFDSYSK